MRICKIGNSTESQIVPISQSSYTNPSFTLGPSDPTEFVSMEMTEYSTGFKGRRREVTEVEDASRTIKATEEGGNDEPNDEPVRNALLATVMYSANLGGTGVLTGTATNLVFKSFLDR